MQNSADNLAARRALITAGIVGGGSALMTELLGVKKRYSFPTALVASLLIDYTINRREIRREIRVSAEFLEKSTKDGKVKTDDPGYAQLVAGFLALLGVGTGAYFSLGHARLLPPPSRRMEHR